MFSVDQVATSFSVRNINDAADAKNSSSLMAKLQTSERMLNSLTQNLNGLVFCALYDAKRTMILLKGDCNKLTGYDAASMLSNTTISLDRPNL